MESTISYKDLAAVAGKPGLFRILKPTRSGVILESLDDQKKKFVAGINQRVSILQEISVYTTDQEGVIGLPEVFNRIHTQFNGVLPIDQKAEGAELGSFLSTVVPAFDRDKVYTSDIRKLVSWYTILHERMPSLFVENKEEISVSDVESEPEVSQEEMVEKPTKTKKK